MKRSFKAILALVMTFVFIVTVSGFSFAKAKKDNVVKLKIYVDYADEDTKTPYDYAVAALKKAMPNVELDLDVMARDDGQKLKTYAQTGNLPDIFVVSQEQINIFKKSGNILTLDQYAGDFKKKMIPSNMNELVTDDGHIYSFPFAGNEYITWYYNKDLFKKYNVKVPTNYNELMTAVKKFKANNIIPLSIFAKEKWPCVALYDTFATRFEPKGIMKLDSLQGKASDKGYLTAADRIVKLVDAGLVSKGCTNLNYDQAASLFYQGKAAMFINGEWEIAASEKALGSKVDWMYYPTGDAATNAKTKTIWSGGGGPGGFAVSPATPNKELAAKVAAFMALKYAECKYTTRGNPLVATKVTAPIIVQYPPMMKKLAATIPTMTSTTGFSWQMGTPMVKAALEDASQSLLAGSYTAQQFAKDVDKAIEQAKVK